MQKHDIAKYLKKKPKSNRSEISGPQYKVPKSKVRKII